MISFLADEKIASVLDYESVIKVLDDAYADLSNGQAAILKRQRCAAEMIKFSSMGGVWLSKNIAATKSYPTIKGGFSFLINLFDLSINQPVSVMEAQQITRYRTAAQTAMVAARTMPPQVQKVALFGAGFQGLAQIEALEHRVSFAELAIVDPNLSQVPELKLNGKATIHLTSAQQAVENADIVITATRSQVPVFSGAWLKEGAFVAAIGISSAGARELDSQTFDRAERVIVEWMPQSMQEAGDVIAWLEHSIEQQKKIVDLPQLYSGNWPHVRGIQVFKSVGTGLADTACAWLAWQRSSTAGALPCM